jgi:ABC-2 type transport system permease protein
MVGADIAVKKEGLKWWPFLTLYKKEVRRFSKVLGQTIFSPVINSTLYMLIFGVSLGRSIQLSNGFSYLEFLIPGLVMMSVLNNSFQNAASTVVGSKFHGDIQDLRIVPLSSAQIVWAMSLGALTRGLLVGCVTFIAAQVFMFVAVGKFLAVQNLPMLLLFLFLGGLTFAQLGLAVGFLAKSFEHVNAVGSFILLPLLYLGGVFFSIENLHPVWKMVSQINPMLYFINGVRQSFLGISDVPWLVSLAISLVALTVLHIIALKGSQKGSFLRW